MQTSAISCLLKTHLFNLTKLALSGQRSGCCPGLCLQAVGSGLCGQQLRAVTRAH